MTKTTLCIATALLAALAAGAGCGSSCVGEGDRLVVDVHATPDLNDAGSGPQHVRFQVWAVADRGMFDNARADALAGPDTSTFERQGMGKVFVTDSAWITPGATRQLAVRVLLDDEYTHVGIAVLYPEPQKAVVPVDCGEHPGYRREDANHHVEFTLGAHAVEVGGGQ